MFDGIVGNTLSLIDLDGKAGKNLPKWGKCGKLGRLADRLNLSSVGQYSNTTINSNS